MRDLLKAPVLYDPSLAQCIVIEFARVEPEQLHSVFNRPGVAGAVLQTAL